MEAIFPKTPSPTPLEIPIKLHTLYISFKMFGLWDPPPGISNPFCGGIMDVFWNHTLTNIQFTLNISLTMFSDLEKSLLSHSFKLVQEICLRSHNLVNHVTDNMHSLCPTDTRD